MATASITLSVCKLFEQCQCAISQSHLSLVTVLLGCLVRRKKEAREPHRAAAHARRIHGLRAKMYAEGRRKMKIQMKKT